LWGVLVNVTLTNIVGSSLGELWTLHEINVVGALRESSLWNVTNDKYCVSSLGESCLYKCYMINIVEFFGRVVYVNVTW
jgi:hypothetical protein